MRPYLLSCSGRGGPAARRPLRRIRFAPAVAVALAASLAETARAQTVPQAPPPPSDYAFIVRAGPDTVGVDWIARGADFVRGDMVMSRTARLTYTIHLDADGGASRTDFSFNDGTGPSAEGSRTAGGGRIGELPWHFGLVPGMLEQVVLRARNLCPCAAAVPVRLFPGRDSATAQVRLDHRTAQVSLLGMSFDVELTPGGGMARASLASHGVTVERVDAVQWAAYRMEPPNAPYTGAPYRAEEVRVPTPEGHILAGTLTLPDVPAGTRVPVAVTITGLSAHWRNNGTPPFGPFRQVADALGRAGVGVLRLDDRGVAESTGNRDSSTTLDEANDIRAAIAYLRARDDVAPDRVALIGYSEGGLIAPMLAATDRGIAAVVTIGAPGGTGREVTEYQLREALANSERTAEQRDSIVAATIARISRTSVPRQRWYVASGDALETAAQVRAPMLVMHGERDRHVPPAHAERLAAAARRGGNADVSLVMFPNLNHLMLPDPSGLAAGWGFLPSNDWPSTVLDTLARWLSARLVATDAR